MENVLKDSLEEIKEDLKERFEETYKETLEKSGFKADFSAKSIKKMERFINEVYPKGHHPYPTTLIPFSLYLGEVIVRSVKGAKWENENIKKLSEMKISIPANTGKMELFPYQIIESFWENREKTLFELELAAQ